MSIRTTTNQLITFTLKQIHYTQTHQPFLKLIKPSRTLTIRSVCTSSILQQQQQQQQQPSKKISSTTMSDEESVNRSRTSKPEGKLMSVEESITKKLKELLNPITLEVINESHLHSHHSAMRAIGGGSGETHFSVKVISSDFNGLNRLSRHRKIYAALSDEFMERGLHALSLQTYTPEELSRSEPS